MMTITENFVHLFLNLTIVCGNNLYAHEASFK